jgi:hypothetical protein
MLPGKRKRREFAGALHLILKVIEGFVQTARHGTMPSSIN